MYFLLMNVVCLISYLDGFILAKLNMNLPMLNVFPFLIQ